MRDAELRMGAAGEVSATKRALILRDGLTFVVLLAVSGALYGMTAFLFGSFESHRADLARQYAGEGRTELAQGKAAAAVGSLRAALEYAPDDTSSQRLLAQALADSGQIDQALDYFQTMWEAQPGDGFLNLQLARLEAKKGNTSEAVRHYRDSIFGDWRGDGAIKRRDVRLELVDYLAAHDDVAAAKVELLIAAGNAPSSLHLNGMFAQKMAALGDWQDALTYYDKAIADDPRNAQALAGAGRIELAQGEFVKAHLLLDRAVEAGAGDRAELMTMAREAERLSELSLSRELPARERAEHLLEDAKIAQARLKSCEVVSDAGSALPGTLEEIEARWKTIGAGAKLTAKAENAEGQDELMELIFETERAAEPCGKAEGDDALLLRLAKQDGGSE